MSLHRRLGLGRGAGGGPGKKREYPWGDTFDAEKCNTQESGIGTTTPVGRYSPAGDSPYGVADMAGNVREWCADWYGSDYYRQSLGRNPTGPESGYPQVLRGGSYWQDKLLARCAARDYHNPSSRNDNRGFRVGWWLLPPLASDRSDL